MAEDNTILGSQGGRSGRLNNLGLSLRFPDDLGQLNSESADGIIHWVEFTTYYKPNGSLTSIVNKVARSVSNTLGDLGSQFSATGLTSAVSNFLDANSETVEVSNQTGFGTRSFSNRNTRLSRATQQAQDSASIYLPGEIQFTDQINYSDVGFAGIKNLASASAFSSVSRINLLRKLGGIVDKAASIVGQESLNTGQAISAELGVVVNPRKEQMFQGVSFRSFDFKFNLFPRTKKEAATAANLIKMFRFHAYPELSQNGAFLNFPSEFGIKFMSADLTGELPKWKENNNLPFLHRCFLEKIDTNYTPDQIFRSFEDGFPVRVEISLSFKESQYVTRNDVDRGY